MKYQCVHHDTGLCESCFKYESQLSHLQKLCEEQKGEIDWYKESLRRHDEWREQFTARGKDLDSQTVHGCICPVPARKENGTYDWKIIPECVYHATALKYPSNHSIPWNCPTYWDGCNCSEYYDKQDTLEAQLATQTERVKELSEWLKSAGESIKDHCSENHAECIPMCGQGYIDKAKDLGRALNQDSQKGEQS